MQGAPGSLCLVACAHRGSPWSTCVRGCQTWHKGRCGARGTGHMMAASTGAVLRISHSSSPSVHMRQSRPQYLQMVHEATLRGCLDNVWGQRIGATLCLVGSLGFSVCLCGSVHAICILGALALHPPAAWVMCAYRPPAWA